MVVGASSDNPDAVTVQPARLMFTPSDRQTGQVVTVRAGQDEDQEADSATNSPPSEVATTTA